MRFGPFLLPKKDCNTLRCDMFRNHKFNVPLKKVSQTSSFYPRPLLSQCHGNTAPVLPLSPLGTNGWMPRCRALEAVPFKKISCLFQPAATGIGFKFPLCSSPFPKGPPQAVLSLGFGGAAGSYLACTYRQHPLRRCEWSEYHAAEALSVVTGRPQVEKGMI